MDQTVEYHPFGTIVFNFDDVSVKLRRCRLSDYEYAENLLQEIREDTKPERDQIIAGIEELRVEPTIEGPVTPALLTEVRNKTEQLNGFMRQLGEQQQQIVARWLSGILQRMGDIPAPDPKDWPLEIYATYPIVGEDGKPGPNAGQSLIINRILDHWRTRPLAYSATPTTPNGAVN